MSSWRTETAEALWTLGGVFKDDHGGLSPGPAEEGPAGKSAVCASAPPEEKRGHCLLSTFFSADVFHFLFQSLRLRGMGAFFCIGAHKAPFGCSLGLTSPLTCTRWPFPTTSLSHKSWSVPERPPPGAWGQGIELDRGCWTGNSIWTEVQPGP